MRRRNLSTESIRFKGRYRNALTYSTNEDRPYQNQVIGITFNAQKGTKHALNRIGQSDESYVNEASYKQYRLIFINQDDRNVRKPTSLDPTPRSVQDYNNAIALRQYPDQKLEKAFISMIDNLHFSGFEINMEQEFYQFGKVAATLYDVTLTVEKDLLIQTNMLYIVGMLTEGGRRFEKIIHIGGIGIGYRNVPREGPSAKAIYDKMVKDREAYRKTLVNYIPMGNLGDLIKPKKQIQKMGPVVAEFPGLPGPVYSPRQPGQKPRIKIVRYGIGKYK